MSRTKAIIQLANMMERTQDHNIPILQILINCVTKLSKTEKNYIVKETELITNYLDPVISPMFHDPDNNRLFRWLNQKNNADTKEESTRPDGGMTVVNQLQNVYALGFVEVKAIDACGNCTLTHMDTLRLAIFCKSTLDKDDVKCAIGVQAVGTYVTFFLCTIEQEALYPFVKIGRLDVPTSFENLPSFLSQLDTCARIINTYNTFCVKRRQEESARSMIRPSLTQAQLMDVLHLKASDTSPTLKLTPTA
ncbi:hypothetical protein BDB00DRAFT_842195 [Zychaea mexicana]|uniref:uncharacterized protein n=1 Tax=Zychaea mexicana TaxID=64656 RepID=UPI0022FE517C|nr:uncharacterized protein BDB00DRAFT_842195 [Zychaea mexicana]KAI9489606.1 hypothetical protein BDB00DRAFT_842195 [Zychaea mexicana]